MAAIGAHHVSAADYVVRGIVRDSVADTPLGHASVTLAGRSRGTVADDDGIFEMTVPENAKALKISYIGYKAKTVPLRRTSHNMYAVYLSPDAVGLDEVVVKKAKYTKKNNPAVALSKRIKAIDKATDPTVRPNYSYHYYERATLGLNDFKPENMAELIKEMPFVTESVDTSEVTGKVFLPLIEKEKVADVYYRGPGRHKEIVQGLRATGVDQFTDNDAMRTFIDDAFRELDLYDSDITLLQRRFVSPLSSLAPDFYRFYITDTIHVKGEPPRIELSFYPRNKASYGFDGHIYVNELDSTLFVRKVSMSLPPGSGVNFVDKLYITQLFDRGPDGERLKTYDDLTAEMSPFGNGKGGNIYLRRTTAISDHSFLPAPDSIFMTEGPKTESDSASSRAAVYWADAREMARAKSTENTDTLVARLRSRPLFGRLLPVLRLVFSGYMPTGRHSKFDIGPVSSIWSYNSLEGSRFRLGGMTTAQLSRRWFGRGYVAWGTRDHRWKYSAEVEYSFIDKKLHSREFPMRSLRMTSSYDVYRPGMSFYGNAADNFMFSWRRMKDDHAAYRRLNRLDFIWETRTQFSVDFALMNDRLSSARTMPFILGSGTPLDHYDQNVAQIELRYAPGEKFIQGRTKRIPVNFDAPILTLRHAFSPGGFLGSRYTVNRTEVEVEKRFWLSAFGHMDISVAGGHVWGAAPFPSLLIPNANNSYVIQPRSFALLNPMEFICSTAAQWELSYRADGALLNLIPLVKKLHLRETVSWRGWWGRLDDKFRPGNNRRLLQFPANTAVLTPDRTPYMEISCGLENILRVLRLEYVWRLNYRHTPYEIDRHGLRFSVEVNF